MKLISRHFKLFYQDPVNWLICAISVVVILSLYFLFIRDFTIVAIEDVQVVSEYTEQFVDFLMVSGLLIVISATTCLPMASVLVKDKESGVSFDFQVAPISNFERIQSYVLASTLISFVATTITMLLALCLFYSMYESLYTLSFILKCLGCIFLSSYISSCMLIAFSYMFKKMTTFASFGNLFGVMLGFLSGVYIPIGYYPETIQNGIFVFPISTITSLFRKIFTNESLTQLCKPYPVEAKQAIIDMFKMDIEIFNHALSSNEIFVYLFLWIIALNGFFIFAKE